jgi:uncharacterized phiE125 gp8 family phage protein
MLIVSTDQVTETGVVSELISTAQAKAHLRVDISDDDSLIAGLVTAARQHVEIHTGRSFAQHTYRADIGSFHDVMVLPWRPIQSITQIQYYNTDSPEVLTTLSSAIYSLYADRVVRDYGECWPTAWAIRPGAVQITYVTGYLSNASPQAATFPEAIRQAMYLIIGDLYENREAQFTTGFNQITPNRTVDALINPYKVYL